MRARALVVLALVALPLSGCGGDSEPAADKSSEPTAAATAPADTAAATADVKANWAGFFDGSKPAADRAQLVEAGATLAQAMALAGKDPNAAKTRAEVKTVTFTSATEAAVTYDLSVAGAVVLPGAQGKAVLDGTTWKVSKQTFCQLVNLSAGGTPVPGCS